MTDSEKELIEAALANFKASVRGDAHREAETWNRVSDSAIKVLAERGKTPRFVLDGLGVKDTETEMSWAPRGPASPNHRARVAELLRLLNREQDRA